jgi:DNA-binding GntR family transcriptional regulator
MSIGSDPLGRAKRRGDPEFAVRPQLSDDVARVVRRRIFDGTYRAGAYLRLDQLAADLGISVTPVREALLNLRAEGLLVQHPRRGFMVVEFTARDLADVANVQAFVGGELAARAAKNIDAEQLAALTAIQDELEQAYGQPDPDRTVRLNHEFHRLINVAADSPKLTQFMSGITRYAPESVFPTLEGWPQLSTRDHRRVIAAFESGDAEQARVAMAEHFTVGVAPLCEYLIGLGVIRSEDGA